VNAINSLPFCTTELILIGTAFMVLVMDFFISNKKLLGWISVLSVGAALIFAGTQTYPATGLFFNFFTIDFFAQFFRLLALTAVGLTILASFAFKKIPVSLHGEFYFLLLGFGVLLTVMGAATNLLMIFLAVESVSMTSYVLTGIQKFNKQSAEASLKYLLFGAVSSASMLFGMSLLFGATQSIDLLAIGSAFQSANSGMHAIGLVGLLFMLVGLGFKISIVPFHMWAPDVYQGAPTPVTALLTVAPKALGFAVIIRVLFYAFPHLASHWGNLLAVLSILTMTVGNIIAITQADIKRMLAYSSIAQAGYVLAGLAVPGVLGLRAVLIYLLAYLFTNLGAFFTVIAVERETDSNEVDAYDGLAQRNPFLALSMAVFLLSLAGIPPLAGFVGKVFIFMAVLKADAIVLAIAIALNSAVAAYYYFRIIRAMYLRTNKTVTPIQNPLSLQLTLITTFVFVLLIGIFPSHVIHLIEKALTQFPVF